MDAYEQRKRDWEDLDVTREELKNLTDCLKKEEFRKLLIEYAEEVNDPENKKIYEQEITQLEKERGVDVTFVHPEPGYVIKTSVNGDKKCFLNISKSDIVERPTSQPSYDQGQRCLQWSIPYTLIPPRDDLDKKRVRCMVFDVVFHPDTLYLASKNTRFRDMVNSTAMDGIESNFKVKLDRKNIKFPKINFKGVSHPSVIRTPSTEPPKEVSSDPEIYQKLMASYDESRHRQAKKTEDKPQRPAPATTFYNKREAKQEPDDSHYVTPKFAIKHQDDIELQDFTNSKNAKIHAAIPKKLVVTIDLPLLKGADDASLDVQERHLSLKSEKPAKYKLELPLPYCVDPDRGNAKFDPTLKKLKVTLPVIRSIPQIIDTKEDSGVDSDNGSPIPNMRNDIPENSVSQAQECDSTLDLAAESVTKPLIEVIDGPSECKNDCDDTALRTSETVEAVDDSFMLPSIKYSLPPFICNIYGNEMAVTINVKNVDPTSIRHRPLYNNSGVHILLTTVGAGFFPQYYSICLKLGESWVDPKSFAVETWDNNVVFSMKLNDTKNLTHYYVGLNEEFMEEKDLPTSAAFRKKLQDLMAFSESRQDDRTIEVHPEDDKVIINIRSNHVDSDDDEEHRNAPPPSQRKERKKQIVKARSISESSGDELPSSNGSSSQSKGILKSRRMHDFSRSVSESSADENGIAISLTDNYYDSVQEGLSESECSSLKKTVRFNDVVSRQLFRSNSSILGQRKKNQRKLRNKKRAHDRRMSESENSETEERDKYKVHHKSNLEPEVADTVKPILNREKSSEQKSGNIEINASKPSSSKVPSHKCKNSTDEEPPPDIPSDKPEDSDKLTDEFADLINVSDITDISQLEFKNDLIFDLEV